MNCIIDISIINALILFKIFHYKTFTTINILYLNQFFDRSYVTFVFRERAILYTITLKRM
jgi:hypothetical protein